MWLEAIVTRDDFVRLLDELLPVKIHLEPDEDKERWLWLGKASSVSLLEGRGLRAVCNAELQWTLIGMHPHVKIEDLAVVLEPVIVKKHKGYVLEFHIQLEEADIVGLPSMIDRTVVKAINAGLAAKSIAWDFTETLTHTVGLGKNFEPIEALSIDVSWGEKRVREGAVVLAVSFELHLVRTD